MRNWKEETVFSPQRDEEVQNLFLEVVKVMATLRRPGGCPWDAVQTPKTLKRYVVEEAYEVVESIENQDWANLKEELGDYLFQVLFQAEIQHESGRYDIGDILKDLRDKMIRRHPHVFDPDKKRDGIDIVAQWEQIKKEEKNSLSHFENFSHRLPALLGSYKIGKLAEKVGFDWEGPEQVLLKVDEELAEVREALEESRQSGHCDHLEEELGDLLFVVANLVRQCGFEPEETLVKGNRKFIQRFKEMEELANNRGLAFENLNLEDQEALWKEVKNQL